jgi:ribosomal protein L11 methyltransferase
VKRNLLWKISVATSPGAEDAVTELLARTLHQPVASYTDVLTGRTVVTAYLEGGLDWSPANRERLRGGLERIRACGLEVGSGRISRGKLRRKDWAESWKRHFKPISIGPALLIKPSWSKHRPRAGQAVVVLDPGLSFGTGQHPTTAYCLRQLVAHRRPREAQSVLDIGTGSGILAIAAAKLGFAPVEAFDHDPDAVRIAIANARRNRVSDRTRFSRQDLATLAVSRPGGYSIVCANLTADLLLAERQRILTGLHPQGVLVVAGVLDAEFAPLRAAYEAAGLRLEAARTSRHWRSGTFRAAAKIRKKL